MTTKLKNVTVKARMSSDLKECVEEKLEILGLDSATVIRMLYKHIENYNKLPFDLKIPTPNDETKLAIEDIRKGKELTIVSNTDELRKELDID